LSVAVPCYFADNSRMISLQWLDGKTSLEFPPVESALKEPDGLLAAGGDLSPETLIKAYQQGIFPWYSEGEPILWWSPDPRFVLFPDMLKVSRSLAKNVRNGGFTVSMDRAFDAVISSCAQQPRRDQPGTWLSAEMQAAYLQLHQRGYAHSVECWQDNQLVGGLYGVHMGSVFCGESMFSRRSNASKVALVHLCDFLHRQGFKLIDSQVYTEHLQRLGAVMIPRSDYIKILRQTAEVRMPKSWTDLFNQHISPSS